MTLFLMYVSLSLSLSLSLFYFLFFTYLAPSCLSSFFAAFSFRCLAIFLYPKKIFFAVSSRVSLFSYFSSYWWVRFPRSVYHNYDYDCYLLLPLLLPSGNISDPDGHTVIHVIRVENWPLDCHPLSDRWAFSNQRFLRLCRGLSMLLCNADN